MYTYIHTYIHICFYIHTHIVHTRRQSIRSRPIDALVGSLSKTDPRHRGPACQGPADSLRHRLNGYLAQWVPSSSGKHTFTNSTI